MKRRLKLTPFAKLFFAALIIAGSWYIYKHQDYIKKNKIINFNDTSNVSDNSTDTFKVFVKDDYDTLTFYISQNDSLIGLFFNKNEIRFNKNDSINDEIIFKISENKKILGRFLREKKY